MALEIITDGILGPLFRFIGWVFAEIVVDVLVKGLGYLICKPFKPVDIDSIPSLIVGFIAWVAIGALIYFAFASFS